MYVLHASIDFRTKAEHDTVTIDGDSHSTKSPQSSELTPLSMAPKFYPGVLDIRKHADELSTSSRDSTSDCSKNTMSSALNDTAYSSTSATTSPPRLRSRSIIQSQSSYVSSASHSSDRSYPTSRPRSFTSSDVTSTSSRLTPGSRPPSLSTSTISASREDSTVHPPVDGVSRPRRPLPQPPIRRPPIVSHPSRDSHVDAGLQVNAQNWNVSWAAAELPPVYTP